MAALAEELGQLSAAARSARGEADRLRPPIVPRPSRPATRRRRAGRARAPAGAGRRTRRRGRARPGRAGPARRRGPAGPGGGDGRPARAADDGGTGPGPGRPGRRAALAPPSRNGRPGPGRWPAGSGCGARRATAAAVHGRRDLAGGAGRAVAGRGRRRAGRAPRRRGPRPRRPWAPPAPAVRTLALDFESLVDAAHRDEMARAEQRIRVEALTEKARTSWAWSRRR